MNDRLPDLAEIAAALRITKRAAAKRAARQRWEYQAIPHPGRPLRVYLIDRLPADVAMRVMAARALQATVAPPAKPSPCPQSWAYDAEALWDRYNRLPDSAKAKARHRLELIQAAMRLVSGGVAQRRAFELAGQQAGVPWRSIERWYQGHQGRPGCKHYARHDWLAALVPGYVGRTASTECTPEAWEMFLADYLRAAQPAAAACYERLQRAAAERGWVVPSLRTLERRLEREVAPAAITLARQGTEALMRMYPAQQRDRSMLTALEAVNADGHTWDVFVRWPDGSVGRPVMVAWQDIYSGKILSWRIDRTENSDSVRLSFGDLVERYGIPGHAYLDNGRGFAAKWMTGGTPTRFRFKVRAEEPAGVLTLLGVECHWCTPYHGQAKPIERAFRDLCEYVARHPACEGAYTGNRPDAKPENYASRAMPLPEFVRLVDAEITAHNARLGRQGGICAGRSFDQVFADAYARAVIRRPTAAQRHLWLLAAEGVRAAPPSGEITLSMDRRNRYWAEPLAQHTGQRVVVRFDPGRLHEAVHVYSLDGRYICEAACIHAAGFRDGDAARDLARARQSWRRAARAQLDAERRISAAEVASLIPAPTTEEPPAAPKVVGLVTPHPAAQAPHSGYEDRLDMEREESFARAVGESLAYLRHTTLDGST